MSGREHTFINKISTLLSFVITNPFFNCYKKLKEVIKNKKMYCVQSRVYCGVCNKSYRPDDYPNHLKSQGHANNVLKNQCLNSLIIKTHHRKKMKTDLVNNLAIEASYQLHYCKNLHPAHIKINKFLLILISTIIKSFIVIHVCYYLKI